MVSANNYNATEGRSQTSSVVVQESARCLRSEKVMFYLTEKSTELQTVEDDGRDEEVTAVNSRGVSLSRDSLQFFVSLTSYLHWRDDTQYSCYITKKTSRTRTKQTRWT